MLCNDLKTLFYTLELGNLSRVHLKDVKSCPVVEEDGTPFIIKGTYKYLCLYGPDTNQARKRKAKHLSNALVSIETYEIS